LRDGLVPRYLDLGLLIVCSNHARVGQKLGIRILVQRLQRRRKLWHRENSKLTGRQMTEAT
jgi:hypothetical protein